MSKSEVASLKVNVIGQSVLRREDMALLTGRARYVADIQLPGLLQAAILRSPFAHAKITNVDVSAARALPGVELVWTGSDAARFTQGVASGMNLEGFCATVQPVLASEIVHFSGEAVAVVVATSRGIAEDALQLIEIDYDELPVVVDVERAIAEDALANEAVPGNVVYHSSRVKDDVEEVFRSAAVVAKANFRNNRVNASPMETRGCMARYEWTNGQLTLWTATQMSIKINVWKV